MGYLHEWHWPVPQPRGVLALIHGYGEHCGRYTSFADACNNMGLAVVGFDLPGLGQSSGRRGHVESFRDYIDAVNQLVEYIQSIYPNVPIILFGHSMGGLVAVRYLQTQIVSPQICCVVLSSPCLRLSLPVPTAKIRLARLVNRIWPTLTQHSGVRAEHVSRTPDIVQRYGADPLMVGIVTVRWFNEFQQAMERAQVPTELSVPILVLQAGHDRLVSAEANRTFVEHLNAPDKAFRIYENCFHELLNEPEAPTVRQDIFAWLEAHLPASR